MKWKIAVALGAVAGTLAFGQMPIGHTTGTPASGTASRPAGPSDSGPDNNAQVKSIDQILNENPGLTAKLNAILPPDLNSHQACAGFKTIDQCISAIHVAHDVNIPFAGLKAQVTGKHAASLEKAVEQSGVSVNARDAVKKARKAASEDMKGISLFMQ